MAINGIDPNQIIFERRHPELAKREDIWDLILRSYRGGIDYQEGGFLFKNAKEGKASYRTRSERAVYFNQVQPLADLLAGFLFIKPPARKNLGKSRDLIDGADKKKKTIDEFMKIVATYSLLFTCGVLVDSPAFNIEDVQTKKDRKDRGLDPFCVFYYPEDIIDFHISKEDGKLDWIILDNSYYDNSDPFLPGVNKNIRRLWTRESYQDFELIEEGQNQTKIIEGDEIPHPIGSVPFKFANWKDDDNDLIAESVFEDIAQVSRLIYNKMSEMDEMLASGSFRVLMYPTEDGEIPANLEAGGIGALSVIPFDGKLSKAPFFDGAKLEDVEPFLKAMEFYIAEILKKIGLDTDETKDYVKSGLSKKIDFQKVRTLLTSGSMALSGMESWIFQTASKWLRGNEESKAEIHYYTQYADEDIQVKVDMLTELLVLPFKKLRQHVTSLLVKNILSGDLPQSDLDEIYAEIKGGYEQGEKDDGSGLNINDLAADEQAGAVDQNKEEGEE